MFKIFICLAIGGILMTNQANCIDELQKIQACVCVTKVAIGSINRVKIQAVKNAFNDGEIQIVSCSALSGVRPQPLSNEETLQGAINRARDCLKIDRCWIGYWFRSWGSGVGGQVYLCHWGAFVDRNQNTYFTNGPLILLPAEYLKPLLEGQNLEDIMHHSNRHSEFRS